MKVFRIDALNLEVVELNVNEDEYFQPEEIKIDSNEFLEDDENYYSYYSTYELAKDGLVSFCSKGREMLLQRIKQFDKILDKYNN